MLVKLKIAVAGATGRVGRHVVDALAARGCEVVPMSRATGVDLITGAGLAEALRGVDVVVDAATGPSPEQEAATEFFTNAARNLHAAGQRAGVQRMVVVSIIGIDKLTVGYNVAKLAHERAMLAGPIPVRILRAAQFHELVGQMLDWGTQGAVAHVPAMRTQLIAAQTVAEALAELAVDPAAAPDDAPIAEIAGPRAESFAEMAALLAARRGGPAKVEGVINPDDPDAVAMAEGALLPSSHATLAGPTFEEWLTATK